MSRQSMLAASASAAAIALTLPGLALAQNTVSGVEVVGVRNGSLTTTTDTGSRLGITPLETPASIEILSGETLRARGDLSLADAIARSTGIVQQNNPGNGGTANFAARGFSGVGSVTTLVDGMRLFVGAGTVTFPFDPWTVQQVDVLRGPASVMYGQGAIGGAVNVVPKRPDPNMASYDFQAGVGNDGTYRVGVGAGGPVNDQLAYRFDASRNASDGYVDRGKSGSWALSGAIRWAPTDKLSFVLSNDYGNQKPIQYFGTPLVNGAIDERVRHRNYNVSDAILHYKDNFTQLRTEWKPADNIRVRNSTYLLNTNRQWRNAETYQYVGGGLVDRFDYIPIKHDQDQIGDTLDVAFDSEFGGGVKNTLVVGGEANKIKFVHTNDGFPGTSSTVSLLNPIPGLYQFDPTSPFIPRYRTRTNQYGLFAEDQLKLTEQWSIVGGLRYDDYHIRRLNLVTGVQQVDKKLDNVGYRIGVVYAPTTALSFYAQRSTGSDPIGSLITLSAGNASFDLSTGQQWEAGAKGLFLDGKGEWTVAAYHITKKKLLTQDPNNRTQQIQVGEQTSKGLEATVAVQLGAGWSVEANGTVLDADFKDFTENGVSRNGNTPANVPEKSANLWLSWQIIPQVRAYGGVRYVGKQFGDNANTASLILPSYTSVDAGLEWKFKPNLALNLQVFNAFDKLYATSNYGPDQWILARPRAVELRLVGHF